jgi:chaperonin GroES
MSKTVQPISNRVLIKREAAKTTKGGIILPDAAQEKPRMGEVIAVGPGKRDEEGIQQKMHVNVGDRVLFSSYAGTEVKMEDDAEYLIVTEDDILGVIA